MGFEPCVANRRLELIAMCSPVQLPPRAGDAASEARPAAAAAAALAAAAASPLAAGEADPLVLAWPCGAARAAYGAARGAACGVARPAAAAAAALAAAALAAAAYGASRGAACGVVRASAGELGPYAAVRGCCAACAVTRPAAAAAAALAAAATPRHDDEANDEADATHMRGWRRQQPGSLQPFASSVERLPPPIPRRLRPGGPAVESADAERAVAKEAADLWAATEAEGDVSAAAAAETAAETDDGATAWAPEDDAKAAGAGAPPCSAKDRYSSPWAASMVRRIGRTAASLRGTTSARKSAGAS